MTSEDSKQVQQQSLEKTLEKLKALTSPLDLYKGIIENCEEVGEVKSYIELWEHIRRTYKTSLVSSQPSNRPHFLILVDLI